MIGELSAAGIRVPGGFATTADAFREFMQRSGLAARIDHAMKGLDINDVRALARAGESIRGWIANEPLPQEFVADIERAYRAITDADPHASFAVRSSATAATVTTRIGCSSSISFRSS
jgi:pyruvate,water dikinase